MVKLFTPERFRPEGETPATAVRRDATSWQGPNERRHEKRSRRWARLLWSLIYPPSGQRVYPTASGIILISLAMGIGTAAYNTANNILFITLSLLLSCLILSGVLSWMNFSRISWRLRVEPVLRAKQDTVVTLELKNRKRLVPTYGLRFDVRAGGPNGVSTQLSLRERLDPHGGRVRLEWVWRPARRGAIPVELVSVGSLFPFGFLRKTFSGNLCHDAIVWPAPVEYRRYSVAAMTRSFSGERAARLGQSDDLLALRTYSQGDSHRLIHWKASARTRQLLVRQFAAETQEGISLWLESSAEQWSRPEQFELLVAFVATLAEDLFRAGRLSSVAIDREPPHRVRRVRDVEAFLDRLAVLEPSGVTELGKPAVLASTLQAAESGSTRRSGRNVLTFAPDGARGVVAYIDGQKAAAA